MPHPMGGAGCDPALCLSFPCEAPGSPGLDPHQAVGLFTLLFPLKSPFLGFWGFFKLFNPRAQWPCSLLAGKTETWVCPPGRGDREWGHGAQRGPRGGLSPVPVPQFPLPAINTVSCRAVASASSLG